LTRKELLDFLQKNIDTKLNKNQRYGTTLWVLLAAAGYILFQIPDAAGKVGTNDFIVLFTSLLNFIFALFSWLTLYHVSDQDYILEADQSYQVYSILKLRYLQIAILPFCIVINIKILMLMQYSYLLNFTSSIIYLCFSVIYLANFLFLIRYIIVIFQRRKKCGFENVSFAIIKPQGIWISTFKGKKFSLIFDFIMLISFYDLTIQFECANIMNIKFSFLVVAFICLISNCIKQCFDRIDEKVMLEKAKKIIFYEQDIFRIEYKIDALLEMQTIDDWATYVLEILILKFEKLNSLFEIILLCSPKYNELNNTKIYIDMEETFKEYDMFLEEIRKKCELLSKDFCISDDDKKILGLLVDDVKNYKEAVSEYKKRFDIKKNNIV